MQDSDPGASNRRAALIDYSIASCLYKKIKGFRGTPNYAHRIIFESTLCNQRMWRPEPKHDKAGLGFTLAYFANRCMRSWDVGNYPKTMSTPKDDDKKLLRNVMNTRLEKAQLALSDIENCELKQGIQELLNCDKMK